MNNEQLRAIVTAGGGGKFRGVQRVPALPPKREYLLVYFDSEVTGSTMTMRVRKLTAAKVKQHIKESNAKFGL